MIWLISPCEYGIRMQTESSVMWHVHTLDPLIQSEPCLKATALLCTVADHVHPFVTTTNHLHLMATSSRRRLHITKLISSQSGFLNMKMRSLNSKGPHNHQISNLQISNRVKRQQTCSKCVILSHQRTPTTPQRNATSILLNLHYCAEGKRCSNQTLVRCTNTHIHRDLEACSCFTCFHLIAFFDTRLFQATPNTSNLVLSSCSKKTVIQSAKMTVCYESNKCWYLLDDSALWQPKLYQDTLKLLFLPDILYKTQ